MNTGDLDDTILISESLEAGILVSITLLSYPSSKELKIAFMVLSSPIYEEDQDKFRTRENDQPKVT